MSQPLTLELNLQDVSQPLQVTIGGQQCLCAIPAVDLHQLDQIRHKGLTLRNNHVLAHQWIAIEPSS